MACANKRYKWELLSETEKLLLRKAKRKLSWSHTIFKSGMKYDLSCIPCDCRVLFSTMILVFISSLCP